MAHDDIDADLRRPEAAFHPKNQADGWPVRDSLFYCLRQECTAIYTATTYKCF